MDYSIFELICKFLIFLFKFFFLEMDFVFFDGGIVIFFLMGFLIGVVDCFCNLFVFLSLFKIFLFFNVDFCVIVVLRYFFGGLVDIRIFFLMILEKVVF